MAPRFDAVGEGGKRATGEQRRTHREAVPLLVEAVPNLKRLEACAFRGETQTLRECSRPAGIGALKGRRELPGAFRADKAQGLFARRKPAREQDVVEAELVLGQEAREIDRVRLIHRNLRSAQALGRATPRVHQHDPRPEADGDARATALGVLVGASRAHDDEREGPKASRIERRHGGGGAAHPVTCAKRHGTEERDEEHETEEHRARNHSKTTVLFPYTRMRSSRCQRTARARTVFSTSRPFRTRSSIESRW